MRERRTYLLIKLDPCRLEQLNDFSSAEWVGELGLREALVLFSLAERLRSAGASGECVQRHGHVLAISYLF